MAGEGSVNGIRASDPHADTYLAIWFFFQIAADHVCLPILVATFLIAKSVKRNPTLINMCITWMVAGISSTLLLYAGKQSGPEPGHTLCVLQASLLEGTPPMCSLSALALIFTIWTSVSYMSDERDSRATKYGRYAILIAPYGALFGFALATSLVAIQDLSKVNRARRFFYCSVKNGPLSNTMGMFSAIVCLICVFLEVLIAIRIIRTWRAFRCYRGEDRGRGFDKQLILRMFIFSGYLLVALVFSAASVPALKSVVPDLFAASIGMAVFLVFGTHPDVIRTWAFWLPARAPPPPPKDTVSSLGPSHRDLPVNGVIYGGHTDTIFSETETLRESDSIPHFREPRSGMSSPSGNTTPASRASLMSRKGDSVIIINKPEEAFRGLGRGRSV